MLLRPLHAADLVLIDAWFDDPQTQRWLGGRDWPAQALQLADPRAGRFALLALDQDQPVGLLDVELDAGGTASFAVVVDPRLRRRGIARRMFAAMLSRPELAGVHHLTAGVEHGNTPSERLLRTLGFTALDTASDPDFTDFAWHRSDAGSD